LEELGKGWWGIETLKALRGADDAEKWCFSGLSAVQCTQRFKREHHGAALAAAV
jgi:hypothetical protein